MHHIQQNGHAESWGNRHQVVGASLKERPVCYATPDPLSNCFLSYEPKEIDNFPSCIGSDQNKNKPTYPWKVLGQTKNDTFGISNTDGHQDQPFRCTSTYEEYSLEAKRGNDRRMSISHAPVGPGPPSHDIQSHRWKADHQTTSSNPAKFLVHEIYLEEIPLPPSGMGSNSAWRESTDLTYQPINSYSPDVKKPEIAAGGWNLFGERLDSLHTSLSDPESPQLVPAKEVIDTGNFWSNRLLRGDSEKKSGERR